MLSYKEYKQFNESVGVTLGLKSPQSLGLMGVQTKSVEEMLEEAKKKCKKMLAGSGEESVTSPDDEDGEVVPAKAVKDNPKDDVELDSDDVVDDSDDEGVSVGDEEEEKDFPKFSKKKMSSGGKCSKCGKSPCKCKKNESEEHWSDFINSLKSYMKPSGNYWDGVSTKVSEEIVLPESDPNLALVAQDSGEPVTVSEPAPGEVGFAPEQSLGSIGGGFDIRGYLESISPIKKK